MPATLHEERILPEKVGKDGLIHKLGRKQRGKNQIVLVVFELGQPALKKGTDGIALNVVVAVQIVGHLDRDIAWTLQLSGESIKQVRHAFSI
jgi:hypothetical protein